MWDFWDPKGPLFGSLSLLSHPGALADCTRHSLTDPGGDRALSPGPKPTHPICFLKTHLPTTPSGSTRVGREEEGSQKSQPLAFRNGTTPGTFSFLGSTFWISAENYRVAQPRRVLFEGKGYCPSSKKRGGVPPFLDHDVLLRTPTKITFSL